MNDTIYVLFESDGEMRPSYYMLGWFENRDDADAEARRLANEAASGSPLSPINDSFFVRPVKKGPVR